jgi:hypothetical protein
MFVGIDLLVSGGLGEVGDKMLPIEFLWVVAVLLCAVQLYMQSRNALCMHLWIMAGVTVVLIGGSDTTQIMTYLLAEGGSAYVRSVFVASGLVCLPGLIMLIRSLFGAMPISVSGRIFDLVFVVGTIYCMIVWFLIPEVVVGDFVRVWWFPGKVTYAISERWLEIDEVMPFLAWCAWFELLIFSSTARLIELIRFYKFSISPTPSPRAGLRQRRFLCL